MCSYCGCDSITVIGRFMNEHVEIVNACGQLRRAVADGGDQQQQKAKPAPKAQPKSIIVGSDSIPDSLLHPHWKVQRTQPVTEKDLDSHSADLRMPDNIKQDLQIKPVKWIDEVLQIALQYAPEPLPDVAPEIVAKDDKRESDSKERISTH